MPFPLLWSDERIKGVLEDPEHIAHGNVSRQEAARRMDVRKLREAEARLGGEGRLLKGSFAQVLDGEASRVYACFARLAGVPEEDVILVREMVRLDLGLDSVETDGYLAKMEEKLRQTIGSVVLD